MERRTFTQHVAHVRSMRTIKVGDRIRVTISGRTGTVIGEHVTRSGWKVRWDDPQFGVEASRVMAHMIEKM